MLYPEHCHNQDKAHSLILVMTVWQTQVTNHCQAEESLVSLIPSWLCCLPLPHLHIYFLNFGLLQGNEDQRPGGNRPEPEIEPWHLSSTRWTTVVHYLHLHRLFCEQPKCIYGHIGNCKRVDLFPGCLLCVVLSSLFCPDVVSCSGTLWDVCPVVLSSSSASSVYREPWSLCRFLISADYWSFRRGLMTVSVGRGAFTSAGPRPELLMRRLHRAGCGNITVWVMTETSERTVHVTSRPTDHYCLPGLFSLVVRFWPL